MMLPDFVKDWEFYENGRYLMNHKMTEHEAVFWCEKFGMTYTETIK